MKKIKYVIIVILLILMTACSQNSIANNEIKKLPTLKELIEIFKDVDVNYYINTVKSALAQIPEAELNAEDFKKFINDIKETYGETILPKTNNRTTLTNISDLTKLCSIPSTTKENDAIMILNNVKLVTEGNSEGEKVTVVALQGTDLKNGQATGIIEDLLAGLELHNHYLYDAYNAILNNFGDNGSGPTSYVQKDEKGNVIKPKLYITGLSLGGMVAQQLAGLDYLKENYDIKYVVTMASPIISPEIIGENTNVVRMVLEEDVVPKLSQTSAKFNESSNNTGGYVILKNKNLKDTADDIHLKNNKRVMKNNKIQTGEYPYKTFIGAHVVGYANKMLWGNVDVLGKINGNTQLVIQNDNEEDILFYTANVYESYKEIVKK